jgi:PPK2 family polyphosphate:nucleotide phosphotransferase
MNFQDIARRFRIDKPDKFRMADHDPADTNGLSTDKGDGKDVLEKSVERLGNLQNILYAENRWAVLIVLQGMDTAGKDGIIDHVMAAVEPQGCEVTAFKQPSAEELGHDFLWRVAKRLPTRGRIGIFNRSYYEDVVVVRVHPELLQKQQLPPALVGKNVWEQRFEDIRGFEQHLARSGTLVLKFFLNVSRDEQRQRLLDRLDDPDKRWKFSMGDITERALWPKYMEAYEEAIRATSTKEAPWFVVPADKKWFSRLVVAAAVIDAIENLGLKFPKVDDAELKEMAEVRKTLLAEKGGK